MADTTKRTKRTKTPVTPNPEAAVGIALLAGALAKEGKSLPGGPKIVPKPLELIPQTTIAAIYDKRTEVANLTTKLNKLKKELEAEESTIVSKLQTGAVVAPDGVYLAGLDVAPGRCTPKWKDEAILLAVQGGKTPAAYEAEIKAKYPPESKTSLQISKVG